MTNEIRRDDYIRQLLKNREREVIKTDVINERNILKGEGLTSPTSNLSTEETRILMELMERENLFKVTEAIPSHKKSLTLKRFFKMKRNQQVEVYSKAGSKTFYTEGKVSAIGRNFVMITDLKDRIWIPFEAIESANIPYGIPNYSNTHQHFIYDNNLREKLVRDFGKTVSQRDVLMQQFNEETLHTNLGRWKGTWVEILCENDKKTYGKVDGATNESIWIARLKRREEIPLASIRYVKSMRFLQALSRMINWANK
ncbi:hypothetical protein IM538_05620 [Cytobacillus suaedae]|nr:hypothetical protein IM538_05620 [Cytobacillus suaedae]